MRQTLHELLKTEEERLKNAENPNEKVNILYNLIIVKGKNNIKENIYIDTKTLLNSYIELVKINDFGYDLICQEKILKIIKLLNLNEQLAILNYLLSSLAREFPEMEKEWIQDAIKRVKIKKIIKEKKYHLYPQAILLFSSLSIYKLILALSFFIFIVFVTLLPAPRAWMAVFHIKYANYADTFYLNHFLNILSNFCDIDNGCEILALNYLGLLVQICGKVLFILLIANFIYKKLSDQISIR